MADTTKTSDKIKTVHECAWCGDTVVRDRPPMSLRGEVFCSPSHRDASARAVRRLLDREAAP